MAVAGGPGARDDCPVCGSREIQEVARYESDPILFPQGDVAVYECRSCWHEWDSSDLMLPETVEVGSP